ncbi:MAG: hypothetical protein II969_08880 [Anaerolineaceae bacterium]|nr:hypothetical protein [Anaerolineaceae bacterium]
MQCSLFVPAERQQKGRPGAAERAAKRQTWCGGTGSKKADLVRQNGAKRLHCVLHP